MVLIKNLEKELILIEYHMHTTSMIRDVKPFSAKQWAWLHERMKEGPTEEQTKKMKEIKKRLQKLRPVTE